MVRAGGSARRANQLGAVWVADRFHLQQNLSQAVERDVAAARNILAAALAARAQNAQDTRTPPVVEQREWKVAARTRTSSRRRPSAAATRAEPCPRPGGGAAPRDGPQVRRHRDQRPVDRQEPEPLQHPEPLPRPPASAPERGHQQRRPAHPGNHPSGLSGTEQQVQRYLRRFRTGPARSPCPTTAALGP